MSMDNRTRHTRHNRAVGPRIFVLINLAARLVASLALLAWTSGFALAEPADAQYGAELEGFDYPYPVQRFAFTSQGQAMSGSPLGGSRAEVKTTRVRHSRIATVAREDERS